MLELITPAPVLDPNAIIAYLLNKQAYKDDPKPIKELMVAARLAKGRQFDPYRPGKWQRWYEGINKAFGYTQSWVFETTKGLLIAHGRDARNQVLEYRDPFSPILYQPEVQKKRLQGFAEALSRDVQLHQVPRKVSPQHVKELSKKHASNRTFILW